MATSTATREPSRIRILSLDGGGVRGLSSLLILRKLIRQIELRKGDGVPIRPCECFELIIGTGTGGISALLLGRMGLTVDEAINAYVHIAASFTPSLRGLTARFYRRDLLLDGDVLSGTLGDMAEKFLGDRDAQLFDPSRCRTAVLATNRDYADAPPRIFRSYEPSSSKFTVREVACASAATEGVFPPVILGSPPVAYISAVGGYNNPTEVGIEEAAKLWRGRDVDCLVSLGTGVQGVVSVGEGWARMADACRSLIRSCELVHDKVVRNLDQSIYFRFSVDRGLEAMGDMGVMGWGEASCIQLLTGITEAYMRWWSVDNRLDACVVKLSAWDTTGVDQSTRIRHQHEVATELFLRRMYEWVASANSKPIFSLAGMDEARKSSPSDGNEARWQKDDLEKELQAHEARAVKYKKETEDLELERGRLRAQLQDAQMAHKNSEERWRRVSDKILVTRNALNRQ